MAITAIYVDSIAFADLDAEYAIVYGNKVNEDGSLSPRLKARLDAAVKLLRNGQVRKLVVSGGIGQEGFSEANVMNNYLLKNEVQPNNIIVDIDGYTSSKTSINAADLIGKNSSVIAVSQRYHISRTKLSLRNAGFSKVYGSSPDYYEIRDIYSSIREVPAWFVYWFKGL